MSKFLYKARFESQITASLDYEKDIQISRASIDSLKSLMPENVKLKENIDLIGVSFNGAVINQFNKNHDGIDTAAAIAFKDYFVHKPTNIEHKTNRIVGHIVNAGFSSFSDSKILSVDDVKDSLDPFNLACAAVVYKEADESFADLVLQSSDPKSLLFGKVSASWEIGFSEYYIAIGGINLKDCEIITDPKKIKELSVYLKAKGGEGNLPDGTMIRRLVTGRIYPLGFGFTGNPAANVKGIVIDDNSAEESSEESSDSSNASVKPSEPKNNTEENESSFCIEINSFDFLSNKLNKNISHSQSNLVNTNKSNLMDLAAIIAELNKINEAAKNNTGASVEKAVASTTSSVVDALRSFSKEYEDKIAAEKTAKETLAKDLEALKATAGELAETKKTVAELQSILQAKASEETFSARLSELEAIYAFTAEDRKFVALDLKSLAATDEAFNDYKTRAAVIFASKNKQAIADAEKSFAEKVEAEVAKRVAKEKETATASTTPTKTETATASVTAKEIVASVAEVTPTVTSAPSSTSESKKSWKDRLKKEGISVK